MVVFKCQQCGKTIELEEGATIGACPYCGSEQILPLDDETAETRRKDEIYESAVARMSGTSVSYYSYETAAKQFQSIPGWRDADEKLAFCQQKLEELKAKAKSDSLERERLEKESLVSEEKAAKKKKRIAAIVIPALCLCVVFVVLLVTVILPSAKYHSAIELYEAERYEEALAAFQALNGYKDSEEQIKKCETAMNEKYDAALDLYHAGKYEEAIEAFKALNGYKDSTEQIKRCKTALNDQKYNAAVELYNAGKYEEALAAFQALNGYKDSIEQIAKCETAINDQKYFAALELYDAGRYEEAIEAFKALKSYKDSEEQLEKCYIAKYGEEKYDLVKNIKKGDIYRFGAYEQNGKTSDGKEEIEWIVLDKDGMALLLISKYALDGQPYHVTQESITWGACSLRAWLNETFLADAFGEREQAMIQNTIVWADRDPVSGKFPKTYTEDRIFLLSDSQANEYFASDEARRCIPTDYALERGVYASNTYTVDGSATCWWWLRSPGDDTFHVMGIHDDGSIGRNGIDVYYRYSAVRPVLWISLE